MSFLPIKTFLNITNPSKAASGGTSSYVNYTNSIKKSGNVHSFVEGRNPFNFMQYPLDAADQKHYILFDILRRNEQNAGKKLEGVIKNPTTTTNPDYLKKIYTGANRFYNENSFQEKGLIGQREVVASIALYMPQTIKLGFKADYGADDQGIFAGLSAKIQEGLTEGIKSESLKNLIAQAGKNIGSVISLVGFEGLGTAGLQRRTGIAAAPLQEMIFNQIDFRSFSFEFKFTPRSLEESNQVKKILDTIRNAMLPSKIGGGTAIAAYSVPDEFVIRFMHGTELNKYIDPIGLCACTDIDVTYGGNKFATHASGDPVSISATMGFRELELIERKRYASLRGFDPVTTAQETAELPAVSKTGAPGTAGDIAAEAAVPK